MIPGADRLALGTAQFGLPYGIANKTGQVPRDGAAAILGFARQAGISTVDTAMSYGDSESRLGEIGLEGLRLISKLPAIPPGVTDVRQWVRDAVAASLSRLRLDSLHALLLHHPPDLLGASGDSLKAAVAELKEEGRIKHTGVSVYDPEELESLWPRYRAEVVQLPLNVIDRRFAESGWLKKLRDAGVEIHARSAFLQGSLLLPSGERPGYFSPWKSLFELWDDWVSSEGVTRLAAALSFVAAQPEVAHIVVGVDSVSQLKEIVTSLAKATSPPPAALRSADPGLVNPSRWKLA